MHKKRQIVPLLLILFLLCSCSQNAGLFSAGIGERIERTPGGFPAYHELKKQEQEQLHKQELEQQQQAEALKQSLAKLEILDYVDILLNSKQYDGTRVTTAGRIEEFAFYTFYNYDFSFRSRIRESFNIELTYDSYQGNIKDHYSIGDYVIVQGVWDHDNFGSLGTLSQASVLAEGSIAEEYCKDLQDNWQANRQKLAETAPLVDYMDLLETPELFDGQVIRTAGQIQSVTENSNNQSISFSFRSRKDNNIVISVSLREVPQALKEQLVEDEYIVLSGVFKNDTTIFPDIMDCHIEQTGPQAEAVALDLDRMWSEQLARKKADYAAQCSGYNYKELARFPQKYTGTRVEVSGTVLHTDHEWGEYYVLLDVGGGNLLYINYTGLCYRDPEILKNDQLTFWGEAAGTKTHTDAQGFQNVVPLVCAPYCNINELA